MSNDTMVSILLILLLGLTFMVGLALGYLRRDTEWRRQQTQGLRELDELDDHWNTTIRDGKDEW